MAEKNTKGKSQVKRQRAKFSDMGVYYFEYKDPKYFHRLHKFDQTPLIYPLDVTPTHTLAINLHWINPIWRVKFILMLNKASKKLNNKRRFVKWVYLTFKTDPKLKFAYPAIRRYINKRIKNTKRITREELSTFTLLKTKYRSNMVKGGLNQ